MVNVPNFIPQIKLPVTVGMDELIVYATGAPFCPVAKKVLQTAVSVHGISRVIPGGDTNVYGGGCITFTTNVLVQPPKLVTVTV